jgi:hypothetical protein
MLSAFELLAAPFPLPIPSTVFVRVTYASTLKMEATFSSETLAATTLHRIVRYMTLEIGFDHQELAIVTAEINGMITGVL